MFTLWLWLLRAVVASGAWAAWRASHGQLVWPAGVPVPGPIFAIATSIVLGVVWAVTELLARNPPPPDVQAQLEAAYQGRPYVPQLEVRPQPAAKNPPPPSKKEPIPDRAAFVAQALKLGSTGKWGELSRALPGAHVLDLLLEATEQQERAKLLPLLARALEAAGDLDAALLRARQARALTPQSALAREVLCRVSLAREAPARLDELFPLFKELLTDWKEEYAPLVVRALEVGLTRPAISARLVDQVWELLGAYRRFDEVAGTFALKVEEHVADYPERADLLTLVARLKAAGSGQKQAHALAMRALDRTPECPAMLRFLVELQAKEGKLSELARELVRRKAAAPASPALDAALAQVDSALQAAAAEAARHGKPLPPLDRGMGHLAGGDYAAAVAALQEALKTAKLEQTPFIRYLLARAFLLNGQPDPALEHVDRLDPADLLNEQKYDLAADLEAAGKTQLARRLYASVAATDRAFRDVELCLARVDRAEARDPQKLLEEGIAASLPARYRGPRLAGHGGMGIVYRAQDADTGRQVAVKMLNPLVASESDHRRRFLREARTLAELSHPGVVKVLEIGEKPVPFYSMEYLEGVTLSARLAAEGRMEPYEASMLGARVAEVLAYCHAKGLVHRDVKPSNIFLERTGRVTVIDFGLVHAQDRTALTRTGSLMGTPAYMAPEQVSGEAISPATDIYALGVTLFEAVTGRLPFEGEDLIGQVLSRKAPSPREVAAVVPEALDAAIQRCLEKDPARRFSDASELAAALASV